MEWLHSGCLRAKFSASNKLITSLGKVSPGTRQMAKDIEAVESCSNSFKPVDKPVFAI